MKFHNFLSILFICAISVPFLFIGISYAAHPLITDDTGTQGKGRFQLEINGETSYDKEREYGEDSGKHITLKETGGELATAFSYGITDATDLVVGLPYQWSESKEDSEVVSDEDGISDVSLEVKWMFYEKDGLSFGLKPGVTVPTGDDDRGLGTGRMTYSLFLITTKEIEPWAFHFNAGYIRNENRVEERRDIWHVSLAMVLEIMKGLTAVANAGIEKNPDASSHTDPAFILGGLIYTVTDDFDVDLGVKAGLNKTETDRTLLAGVAVRF